MKKIFSYLKGLYELLKLAECILTNRRNNGENSGGEIFVNIITIINEHLVHNFILTYWRETCVCVCARGCVFA